MKAPQTCSEKFKMNKTTKIILTIAILVIYLFSIVGFASALTLRSVSTSPNEIEPGKTVDVLIGLKNDGDNDLTDVSISLDLTNVPFAPSDSSSEIGFDEILSGKTKEASFNLIALNNANSGIYKIPVNIKYTEDVTDAQQKTKTGLISVTINSKPIIDVQTTDSLLITGQEGKINVKVVNKGLSDIKFLEVELGSSTYYSLTSSNKVYIGDLDSNDFDTAEFNVFFKTGSTTNLNIPVKITYKDIFNKEFTEDFSVPVKVYSQKDAISLELIKKSNTTTYVVIIVILIIVYIIYRRIKKRRKLKKTE